MINDGAIILFIIAKIVGGIYDDRSLWSLLNLAIVQAPNAKYELPYDGAKGNAIGR